MRLEADKNDPAWREVILAQVVLAGDWDEARKLGRAVYKNALNQYENIAAFA